MSTGKTFIRITNKDIYDKLENIEKQVMKTNGNVRLNRWISTTALTLAIASIITLKATGII